MVIIPDFKNKKGLWAKTHNINNSRKLTKSYKVWSAMLERCKPGSNAQKRGPSYVGCIASDNFKDFQYFTNWHMNQVGYSIEGYHLDKDILVNGNKVYGENTCCLVPSKLNFFLISNKARRGKYPQGVSWATYENKFVAHISIDARSIYLGYSSSPEGAYILYKEAKEKEAYRWYERLLSGEFIVDERVIERMRTWKLND